MNFKALGVLEKGHLIETDRSGLVAGYVGQTAAKTIEICQKSLGSILAFISIVIGATATMKYEYMRMMREAG